ncbi:hypothetical protein GALMADRAFT_139592 [Galerina marginata CBS 339.88]|uniref:DUF6533 domain-containing protein n=1 Tax=Galerina marginata (strain CBS 339.88) TaxID=685588 RepID=A0A067TCH6_GALM3|nr:hypothetical protein GALMADRAFT_139592 [Galerina marginata CBS 339.88]
MSEIGPGVVSPHMFDLFRDIQAAHCARMASNGLILYDYLITIDKEVELVWNNKRSVANVLFLLNRYYILSSSAFSFYGNIDSLKITVNVLKEHPSLLCPWPHSFFVRVRIKNWNTQKLNFDPARKFYSCGQYLEWEAWTGLVALMLAQAILQFRIYALYTHNKKILALMLTCYFVQSVLSGWIIIWSNLSQLQISVISFVGGESCVSSNANPLLYVFYVPPMLFDGLLCALALTKGLREFKHPGSFFAHGQSLMKILIRDSVFYFATITMTYLVCTVYLRFESAALTDATIGFAPAMSSILASRVLFNLREAGLKMAEVYSTPQEMERATDSKSNRRKYRVPMFVSDFRLSSPLLRTPTVFTITMAEAMQTNNKMAETSGSASTGTVLATATTADTNQKETEKVIRISNHGKMKSWIANALAFFEYVSLSVMSSSSSDWFSSPRQTQTPFMRITCSLSEHPDLLERGATYQPPTERKLSKSGKQRAKKRAKKEHPAPEANTEATFLANSTADVEANLKLKEKTGDPTKAKGGPNPNSNMSQGQHAAKSGSETQGKRKRQGEDEPASNTKPKPRAKTQT